MCDMQNIPTEDAPCEEDEDMNFAAFSAMGGGGPHFVTTSGQIPVGKLQQNVTANLQQVVGMVGTDGNVQYVRTVDGSGVQTTPHLISVPIALPGAKPGDPPSTVQIQVLAPNVVPQHQHQQQPKYHMQIPIQGLHQGGAVLTFAYSPETSEASGLQLLGNSLPEGIQVVSALPPEMQMVPPQHTHDVKDHHTVQHQVFIAPNQQIIINKLSADGKVINNNTSSNNNNTAVDDIVIKEECDDNTNDDESSQGTETSDSMTWPTVDSPGREELMKYLNTLPPQQAQQLPPALRQFLKLNPAESNTDTKVQHIQIEVSALSQPGGEGGGGGEGEEPMDGNDISMEEDSLLIEKKKKKKYKKKPPKPARPKPGQVVIAQAADGTTVYCCPECQMAYQDKDQLEMHLVVHKIERRYICGICGAGLKRKEHLERHKLGHNPERPFVCSVCNKGFKRREHLNLHTVIHSGVKTEMCKECGKGFYRKDHLRKHTRSHEHRRLKEESHPQPQAQMQLVTEVPYADVDIKPDINNTILPEITIHVPTSSNINVPVQINIPQHVVSSLAAAQQQQQQQQQQHQQQSTLDALLAHHS